MPSHLGNAQYNPAGGCWGVMSRIMGWCQAHRQLGRLTCRAHAGCESAAQALARKLAEEIRLWEIDL